jgi:adenine-specific DNA-methyltransferase
MSLDEIPQHWSKRFGLAVSPLFEHDEVLEPHRHSVFLDGGEGTFALTISEEEIWREQHTAAWAWSSDIPHHVTVTPSKVAVIRWDNPADVTLLNRASVDRNLDDFYKYIATDSVRSTRSVVYHLLGLFRRIRSLAASAEVPDARASEIFLLSLARLISGEDPSISGSIWGIADDAQELYARLDQTGLAVAVNEIKRNTGSFEFLQLYPALAIRHAGGLLFQEAHFELIRAPAVDFFGHINAPKVDEVGRGGAHFTPPALARSLVESAIGQLSDLTKRPKLTVCDPACGSGVFLHEVLRALRRTDFSGELILVGQDISEIAISMARFVLKCAIRDWSPAGGVKIHLRVTDSLEPGSVPRADLVVMNPPFISWGSQTDKQRSQLLSIVGRSASSRGDLSMAFVVRALEALTPDGVMGALFPASLLSQGAAANWRDRLVSGSDVRLLASIGDYGLFTHALVQVACAVVRNRAVKKAELTAVVAGDETYATGNALRALRRAESLPPAVPIVEEQWSVFALDADLLKARATWRLRPPVVDAALHKLEEALPTVVSLFDVRQGVQTGYNPALLLNKVEWLALPKRERAYFRSATMSDSIQNGVVVHPYYLFFPHSAEGPIFENEKAIKDTVPEYYRKYLLPNRERLASRAAIRQANRKDWWGLMRARSWSFEGVPRIISKYFSGEGGFFVDQKAEYLPSTGFAWLPKPILRAHRDVDFSIERILLSYAALFNSSIFGKVLQYYAPHVSGGQFDLSPRYVNSVPLPNMAELITDPVRGQRVRRLAKLGALNEISREDERESIVADIYGAQIIASL